MDMKSLIVGASLVIVGALVGFGMSMKTQCPMKGKKACAKMQQNCMYNQQGQNGPNCYWQGQGQGQGQKCKKGPHKAKFEHFKQMLISELALTEEQTAQVEKLFEAKKELRKEKRKEHKQEMRAEMKKTHEEISALLTAEQKVKFENIIKEHKPRY